MKYNQFSTVPPPPFLSAAMRDFTHTIDYKLVLETIRPK